MKFEALVRLGAWLCVCLMTIIDSSTIGSGPEEVTQLIEISVQLGNYKQR